jgi:GNAT superfamily N-acetyltransferase
MARASTPRRAESITIRAATTDDLAAIVKHRRNMFRDDLGSSARELDAMERTSAPFIERGLREGWYHGWLAIAGGKAVAGAGVITYHWPSNPKAPEQTQRAYLLNVYTQRTFRGRGIARRLVRKAITWTRENGFSTLWLHASKAGRPIYASMGFVATNEMKLQLR